MTNLTYKQHLRNCQLIDHYTYAHKHGTYKERQHECCLSYRWL